MKHFESEGLRLELIQKVTFGLGMKHRAFLKWPEQIDDDFLMNKDIYDRLQKYTIGHVHAMQV